MKQKYKIRIKQFMLTFGPDEMKIKDLIPGVEHTSGFKHLDNRSNMCIVQVDNFSKPRQNLTFVRLSSNAISVFDEHGQQ